MGDSSLWTAPARATFVGYGRSWPGLDGGAQGSRSKADMAAGLSGAQ